jgi:hypothetical protein
MTPAGEVEMENGIDLTDKAAQVQRTVSMVKVILDHQESPDQSGVEFGKSYQRYSNETELGENAKAFHDRAGEFDPASLCEWDP